VGQTAPKVQAAVADAMGGCLFIDEAYALAGGSRGPDSFSGEAIRMLLTELENNRGDLLVILAGYEGPMEGLMKADPGLNRRFPVGNRLLLPNYTPTEVSSIADGIAKRRFSLTLDTELRHRLPGFIAAHHGSLYEGGDGQLAQSNGGLAMNLVEQALTHLAVRVVEQDLEGEAATILTPTDFGMAAEVTTAEARHQTRHQSLQPTPARMMSAKLGSEDDWVFSSGSLIKSRLLPSDADDVPPPSPPPTRTRTRTGRAPPRSSSTPSQVYQPPVKEGIKDVHKEKENAEGDDNTAVAAEVQERLRSMGLCPQSWEWDRSSSLKKCCIKCKHNMGGYGYQCKGGTHWLCDDCVHGPTPLTTFD
jgi:hypothetical protein